MVYSSLYTIYFLSIVSFTLRELIPTSCFKICALDSNYYCFFAHILIFNVSIILSWFLFVFFFQFAFSLLLFIIADLSFISQIYCILILSNLQLLFNSSITPDILSPATAYLFLYALGAFLGNEIFP